MQIGMGYHKQLISDIPNLIIRKNLFILTFKASETNEISINGFFYNQQISCNEKLNLLLLRWYTIAGNLALRSCAKMFVTMCNYNSVRNGRTCVARFEIAQSNIILFRFYC